MIGDQVKVTKRQPRWGLIIRRTAASAFASVLLVAAVCSPGRAFQARTLSDTEKTELQNAFGPSMTKLKGPFAENTCVCTDGRSAPVRNKSGAFQNICGDKTRFCAAFKAPWGRDLEKYDVYIGNIFSRDLFNWDSFTDHHDLVRGYILERFLIDTKPDHKLAQLRQFGGLSGAEYEVTAQPDFFERYLALDGFSDFRHYLLAYELQKRFFARGNFGKMQEVRNMASRIQTRDPKFKPLRDATHNQVSASLIPLLTTYRDKLREGQTQTMIDELISEIDKLTKLDENSLRPQIAEIKDAEAASLLGGYLDTASSGPIEAVLSLSEMMAQSRRLVAERKISPADARRLIDLNIMTTAVIQSRGAALLESGELKTFSQHIRFMQGLINGAYGAGLLSSRERGAAFENLQTLLASPTMDRTAFLERLNKAERIVEWAQNSSVLAFSEVWAQWVYLMPAVTRIPDDILRGSPLLIFAEVFQRLKDAVSGQSAVRHQIFDKTFQSGVRALNPGLAAGKLLVTQKAGTYSRQDIVGLEETPEDLQPTAGIVTQGEGNVVSHVQLLARALGIPNAVLAPDAFDSVEALDGKDVFYAVTPGGRVILKDFADLTNAEVDVIFEISQNVERSQDGSLASGGSGKLHIDKARLDLSANMPVDLATVRRKDSGVRSGPKAAFLGELKHIFPDNVARGVVLPFGVYYDHYQRAKVAVPADLKAKNIATPGAPLSEFVRQTYAKFFGEMIASGMGEKELSEWIKPRLEVITESIMREPLDQRVKDVIRDELDKLGLLSPDDKTQTIGCFVRSDTNVEDLENFNGAGLNLTIFDLKSLDQIYAGVKEVWASPFRYRSFSWRQTLIDDPEWVLPSIIILESIPSEKSGVAITADINTNDPDKILIATSEGVGGAVDGTPAETLVWSKDGIELVTMFKTHTRRLLKPEGGVEIVPSTGNEYVLSEEEVAKLAEAAQTIEQTLEPTMSAEGKPRPWDIEYGFADGKLWLFQSRPFIGSDEVANLPALAALDEPMAEMSATVSLEDSVQ